MNDYVIVHHGIKGMHWGVRRFQNKDGTLTAEGKQRYNADGTRKTHRQRLEEKYQSQGKNTEQAKALAEQRVRMQKVLAVAGGVAVTAAVAAAIHYRNKYVVDQLIPEDAVIKRITVDPDEAHLHDRAMYVTTKKRDQQKYVGLLGGIRHDQQQRFALQKGKQALPVNEITMKVRQSKIASAKSGEKAFKELLDNDPAFAKLVRQQGYKNYEAFNRRGLISDDKNARNLQTAFYTHLASKGYDGVIDLNDIKGGFKAKAPTILFGGQVKGGRDVIKSASYRKVPLDEIRNADNRERAILGWRAIAKSLATDPMVIGLTAGSVIGKAKSYIDKPVIEQTKREQAAKRKATAEKRKAQNARIKALAANPDYSAAEIAKIVGVSESRVQRMMSKN